MSKETFEMSAKEIKRARVLCQVDSGARSLGWAARRMGVSYRQAKRLLRRWRSSGEAGLVHGLRGMASNRKLDAQVRRRALVIYCERYGDFGPRLACEKLHHHGIQISDETLRPTRSIGKNRCPSPGVKSKSGATSMGR